MFDRHSLVAAAAVVALSGGAALAQTPGAQPSRAGQPSDANSQRSGSAADSGFAQQAAAGGKKEVESARFAAGKASNADVKAYANHLVADHTSANEELMRLMKTKKIADSGAAAKPAAEAWRNQTGAAFDRAFIDHAIEDHEKTIALFQTESTTGTDPDLKAWATQKLPTLREHLKAAQDLKAKLGATSRQH